MMTNDDTGLRHHLAAIGRIAIARIEKFMAVDLEQENAQLRAGIEQLNTQVRETASRASNFDRFLTAAFDAARGKADFSDILKRSGLPVEIAGLSNPALVTLQEITRAFSGHPEKAQLREEIAKLNEKLVRQQRAHRGAYEKLHTTLKERNGEVRRLTERVNYLQEIVTGPKPKPSETAIPDTKPGKGRVKIRKGAKKS